MNNLTKNINKNITIIALIIIGFIMCIVSNSTNLIALAIDDSIDLTEEMELSAENLSTSNLQSINLDEIDISEFDSINLIENNKYFYLNPKHHNNDGTDNAAGTCTTVAMQLLLGYHNYYSDRRIIPAVSQNGVQFLATNYSNMNEHPYMINIPDSGLGYASLGTEDTVFDEIKGLTAGGELVDQNIALVKDAAVEFIELHSDATVKDEISINYSIFSSEEARAEIDEGRPVILVYKGVIINGTLSYHVVVAYGYAIHNILALFS